MNSDNFYIQLANARRSTRSYLPNSVDQALLHDLLIAARQAPSGANLQPGVFVWVRGQTRQALCADLVQTWRHGEPEVEDYRYFPQPMPHSPVSYTHLTLPTNREV